VDAVLDVDWSPTGKELVSASYNRTIRIFPQEQNRSCECYHVKRMQRIFSVNYSGKKILEKMTVFVISVSSGDAEFVMCGSDEGNIRMWRTIAWSKAAS